MLPENIASSVTVGSPYLPPDSLASDPLQDFERGGVALNDASQGLDVRDWRCFVASNQVDVMLQTGSEPPVLAFSQAGIVRLSFAWDQNMRPTIVYQVESLSYLRWYDAAVASFVTTNLGSLRDVKLSLDDKRKSQLADNSDVILAYIRNDGLYYRQQRDRYTIERLLRGTLPPNTRLINVGMTRGLRLQFELS